MGWVAHQLALPYLNTYSYPTSYKIVSGDAHEIPQSQTADKPMIS